MQTSFPTELKLNAKDEIYTDKDRAKDEPTWNHAEKQSKPWEGPRNDRINKHTAVNNATVCSKSRDVLTS